MGTPGTGDEVDVYDLDRNHLMTMSTPELNGVSMFYRVLLVEAELVEQVTERHSPSGLLEPVQARWKRGLSE